MAAIRKRGSNWQVQIRRQGMSPLSRTFAKKSDATEWARFIESKADRNDLPSNIKILNTLSLRELVERYLAEVVAYKKGVEIERIVLTRFLREPMCARKLAMISQVDFAAYRDRRLKAITPKSLSRQLSPLSNMFRIAQAEWGIPLKNPLANFRLVVTDNRRERRLREGELEKLLTAATRSRNQYLRPIVLFALETGMRRGEILSMLWDHIDVERRSLVIPEAKNGHSRRIPLTRSAIGALRAMGIGKGDEKVFPLTPMALRLAWTRLTKRAGICDLHFHDLRHEAISLFFERGLTLPEVASLSGHRDARMLLRYAHADAGRVRLKLDGAHVPHPPYLMK